MYGVKPIPLLPYLQEIWSYEGLPHKHGHVSCWSFLLTHYLLMTPTVDKYNIHINILLTVRPAAKQLYRCWFYHQLHHWYWISARLMDAVNDLAHDASNRCSVTYDLIRLWIQNIQAQAYMYYRYSWIQLHLIILDKAFRNNARIVTSSNGAMSYHK